MPLIEITNPKDGAVVEGIVEITARVINGEKILTLGFFIDDSLAKFFENEPYSYLWNTIPLPDSSNHLIYAKASLENGDYVYSETISVMVYNILLFYDNFEYYHVYDYPSQYWFQIWPGIGESTYVDTLFSYEGFKSFHLCGSSQWVRTDGIEIDLKKLDRLTYEYALMIPEKSPAGALTGFFVKLNPTLGTIYNGVLFDFNDSLVHVRGVDPQPTGFKWQRNVWYNIKVHLDYDNLLMDVWINSQKIVDDIPAAEKSVSDTFAISTEYGAGGAVYFDDIKIFKR
ncbi:MAG: Ig-like domain-containing protein [candidate division WOR-3 bacterium]|nr:Ig-like domain-containing protein [candidate division WOR-3 bacterium]